MEITVRGGVLKDGRGDRIGKIKKAVIEVEDDWLDLAVERLAGLRGGTMGGVSVVPGTADNNSSLELNATGGDSKGEADRALSEVIDRVWDCYVQTMKPRSSTLGADGRKVIRDALKVASAEECRKAIVGCGNSDFHMGKNDKRRKYNSLTRILKGRRGKETTRERIDFFIDLFEKSGGASSTVPSAPRDVIELRKKDVQRGHRFRDRPDAVQKAEEAEKWLNEHGIKVVRGQDGYPTFEWEDA